MPLGFLDAAEVALNGRGEESRERRVLVLFRELPDGLDPPPLEQRRGALSEELRLLARTLEGDPALDGDADAEHRHEQEHPEDGLRERGHGREDVDEIERHEGFLLSFRGVQRMRNENRAMRTT